MVGLLWIIAPNVASATSMTPDKVQSFVYLIAGVASDSSVISAIGNSPQDLIVLGEAAGLPPLNRAIADPNNNKLIFGYVDIAETTSLNNPGLFSSGSPPSWFGNQNPGYPGLYTVQYWNPNWEPVVFATIDQVIAQGYDGIFLDVLNGDDEWSQGNFTGNPVYPDATKAMATLIADIHNYVATKNIGRPFYLMGNGPKNVALKYPSVLKNFDILFNEEVYYALDLNDGTKSDYQGSTYASFFSSTYVPVWQTSGATILGNDYPSPLADPNADIQSIAYYGSLGWPGSINSAVQSAHVLTTGPYMFTARPARPVVMGSKNIVNFISGGSVTNATLTGGDKGDYFIGGPGQNTITGGAGNDTIYAHPANVLNRDLLDIQFNTNGQNPNHPATVTVLVNGQTAVSNLAITANSNTSGYTNQDVQINTSQYGPLQSLEIVADGIYHTSSSSFNNVIVASLSFEGQALDLNGGAYTSSVNGVTNGTFGGTQGYFNGDGNVSFGPSALQISSPYSANTSDAIDGGGGVNTVIYRAAARNYTIANQADGSVLVTSASTAEGPDTLRNIQFVQFTDKVVAINSTPPIRSSTVFSTAQAGTQSFLRFFNTGATAGTVTATLSDYATGQRLGQWTSDSILPSSELQYAIGTVETGAGITGTKPGYYAVTLDAGISGYFQHVLFRPSDGTLTNSSTCAAGVTADPAKLSGVHSSLIGNGGFPSSIVITNTGIAAETVTLGIYDARDGTKLGTYTTASIPPYGQLIPAVADIEAGAHVTPSGTMYHYVIKAEGAFTGYLQHLVNNTKAAVVTDMTTSCTLDGSAGAAAASPLLTGAIFSTAQAASQSFLRFFNTGTTPGTVTATLRDYATGQALGQWTSPSIAAGAEQQFAISDVERGAAVSGTKPNYYSVSIVSKFAGYFQHVLFRPSDGTLTNLSTCAAGVTADPGRLSGVHSSLLDYGFPTSVVITNTGSSAQAVTLGVYDARDGSKLGSFTTAAIPAGGQSVSRVADIELGANIKPSGSMYHYVLKVESAFTGFLQNLVNNTQAGVITDMTTACALVAE
jgi:cysteinyl-tRNA synthetase